MRKEKVSMAAERQQKKRTFIITLYDVIKINETETEGTKKNIIRDEKKRI